MHRHARFVTASLALAVAVAFFPIREALAGDDDARPYLGVSLSDLGDRQRDRLDLDPRVEGALVTDVRRDSPADRAGLRENDVIVEVDGTSVEDTDAAIAAIRSLDPGERITLTVNRGGLERTLTATLDEWPESRTTWFGHDGDRDAPRVFRFDADGRNGFVITGEDKNLVIGPDEDVRVERKDGKVLVYRGSEDEPEVIDLGDDGRVVIVDGDHPGDRGDHWVMRAPRAPRPPRAPRAPHAPHAPHAMHFSAGADGGFLGVQSQALTDQLRTYFGVDEDHGVLVTDVVEGSPAADAGLRAGDVILEVDGKAVDSPADLRGAVRTIEPGREANLRIVRDRSARTVTTRLARAGDFSDAAPSPGNTWFGMGPDGHGLRLHELDALDDLEFDFGDLHEALEEMRHELHRELPGLHEEIRRSLEDLDLHELKEELHRELPRLHEELRRNLRDLDEDEVRELHEELRRGLEDMRRELENSDIRWRETRREPDFTRDAA